jgi:preprotein translocase subunit SecA
MMIRKIDQLWQEHLLNMDHLRSDVNLRAAGNRDPLLEFKHDAFEYFETFGKTLRTEIAHDLFRFEIITRPAPSIQEIINQLQMETNRSFVPEMDMPPQVNVGGQQQVSTNHSALKVDIEQVTSEEKPTPVIAGSKSGRNDLCPCGSGKKYKKCCGQE